jgi:UDP-glucuronate decarboxylase
LFFDYHRLYGIPIKIARIFNTYGPRMMENDGRVVSNFIVQALRGEALTIYGTGTQTRSFCYVDDLVEGLVRLMNSGEPITGPCNLGNPEEITVAEAARLVIALTGSKSPLRFTSLPADDPKRRRPSIEKAMQLLGWRPHVSLESGLKSTIAYFSLKVVAQESPQIAPIEYAAVSGRKKTAASSADDVIALARSFT